mmetsp:Transcript_61820/g.182510  ORF Transcript_61820/g.182510 Transcript_61820/m.182510 type:complete len:589 (-) Transcript_61820:98-1864(-)
MASADLPLFMVVAMIDEQKKLSKDGRNGGGEDRAGPVRLQLPASYLADLLNHERSNASGESKGAQLFLVSAKGGSPGDATTGTVVLRGRRGDGDADETFEPSTTDGETVGGGSFSADVYVPSSAGGVVKEGGAKAQRGSLLRRLGTASCPRRVLRPTAATVTEGDVVDSKERLREVGKKLRRRLQEERGKRKEIVRINGGSLDTGGSGGPAYMAGGATKVLLGAAGEESFFPTDSGLKRRRSRPPRATPVERPPPKTRKQGEGTKKRPKTAPTPRGGKRPRRSSKKGNIARTLPPPDVSSMSCLSLPRGRRSDTVRLHGLPRGTKPEDVRRLFSGLDPRRVYVLPCHDRSIDDFDPPPAADDERQGGRRRHGPTFRVFVKFSSVAVADMAVERSGEAVRASPTAGVGPPEEQEASVAITPVPKDAARFFAASMAIDGTRGEALETTAGSVESSLRPVVGRALWTAAGRALGLGVSLRQTAEFTVGGSSEEREGGTPSDVFYDWRWEAKQRHHLPVEGERRRLARRYNDLYDAHEQLELEATPLLMHEVFPITGGHIDNSVPSAVLRLTAAGGRWFLDEMKMIRRVLMH